MIVKIGWFILIYLAVGRIIDMASSFTLAFIAQYRDEKRKKTVSEIQWKIEESSSDRLRETIADAKDKADIMFPSKDHSTSVFKLFIFGWILWPITVPLGINEIWNNMK